MTGDLPVTEEEPKYETERWTYLGTRVISNKRMYGWRDVYGRQMSWAKLKAGSPGGIYLVQARREVKGEETSTFTLGDPTYTGDRADDAAIIQAKHWENETRLSRLKQAREDKAAELEEALAPIRAIARNTKMPMDRAALVALVVQRLYGEW